MTSMRTTLFQKAPRSLRISGIYALESFYAFISADLCRSTVGCVYIGQSRMTKTTTLIPTSLIPVVTSVTSPNLIPSNTFLDLVEESALVSIVHLQNPFCFIMFNTRAGAHLAEMSLFLNISNILAVFNVSKPLDKDGMEVEPNVAWTTGATMLVFSVSFHSHVGLMNSSRHLKPFDCQIKPRSKQHPMLLGRES